MAKWSKLCTVAELDLFSTLKSAQCFSWVFSEEKRIWHGVVGGLLVSLKADTGSFQLYNFMKHI